MSSAWFAVLFFVSGFCGLVYQVVWLRLSMAHFGVTTAMVSIVLSVFMAGLALGSFLGGELAERLEAHGWSHPLRAYAACELLIALSGDLVPRALAWGSERWFVGGGQAWGSALHHLAAGAWITAVLLPFATAMGATFPLAVAALEPLARRGSAFGHLYAANVLGAASGALLSAFVLIELLGFRATVLLAAAANATIAAVALVLSLRSGAGGEAQPAATSPAPPGRSALVAALVASGCASMGMEVVWVRQFTPLLGNLVYAFAVILAAYLVATFLGSLSYRLASPRLVDRGPAAWCWGAVAACAVLPMIAADWRLPGAPRFETAQVPGGRAIALIVLGVGPFCALLGFLTPWLVDQWSGGRPRRIGLAYALNGVGCILGPIVTGFLLLPHMAERPALALLAVFLLAAGLLASPPAGRNVSLAAGVALSAMVVFFTADEDSRFENPRVQRDSTARATAAGRGRHQFLTVNGVGMTGYTPITKMMAHLPLAWRETPAKRGLVLCFGMGTTFRSMHSWGIDTTVVELVPGVVALMPEFHPDARALMGSPRAHVVVDDARRFLNRSREDYDVVTLDPPPPVEAAGSSLLYSREFYRAVRRRLAPGGVLQTWVPGGTDRDVTAAIARSLQAEFPHVRALYSLEGWGVHLVASVEDLPRPTAEAMAARLPPAAAVDLVEWGPGTAPVDFFRTVLDNERPLNLGAGPVIVDDRPYNEYFAVRRWREAAGAGG